MIFQSGLTNPFCFAYIAKKNEGEESGENVGTFEIHHILCGDLEINDLILNV